MNIEREIDRLGEDGELKMEPGEIDSDSMKMCLNLANSLGEMIEASNRKSGKVDEGKPFRATMMHSIATNESYERTKKKMKGSLGKDMLSDIPGAVRRAEVLLFMASPFVIESEYCENVSGNYLVDALSKSPRSETNEVITDLVKSLGAMMLAVAAMEAHGHINSDMSAFTKGDKEGKND